MKKTRSYSEKINRFCYSFNGKYYSDKECKREMPKNLLHLFNWDNVEQSAGITDAIMEEIFEGDIIWDAHYTGHGKRKHYYRVVINEGEFGMINISSGSFTGFEYFTFTSEVIIGDIHRNPKLLKR